MWASKPTDNLITIKINIIKSVKKYHLYILYKVYMYLCENCSFLNTLCGVHILLALFAPYIALLTSKFQVFLHPYLIFYFPLTFWIFFDKNMTRIQRKAEISKKNNSVEKNDNHFHLCDFDVFSLINILSIKIWRVKIRGCNICYNTQRKAATW